MRPRDHRLQILTQNQLFQTACREFLQQNRDHRARYAPSGSTRFGPSQLCRCNLRWTLRTEILLFGSRNGFEPYEDVAFFTCASQTPAIGCVVCATAPGTSVGTDRERVNGRCMLQRTSSPKPKSVMEKPGPTS